MEVIRTGGECTGRARVTRPRYGRTAGSDRRRFPALELARFLLIPIVLTALVVLIFMKPWRNEPPVQENGYRQVQLVQKRMLSSVTSLFGGPSGVVWYTPGGAALSLRLRLEKLDPGKSYIFEIQVDSTIYDITSHAAGNDGRIVLDTSLAVFAEGVCVGSNYDPPQLLEQGHRYTIRFWLKRDGNPRRGVRGTPTVGGSAAAELPCRGNGDGDYRYVLLENSLAHFSTSTAASAK